MGIVLSADAWRDATGFQASNLAVFAKAGNDFRQ
jgi:hypothetical protein